MPEILGVKDLPRGTDIIAWIQEIGIDADIHLVMKNGSAELVYRIRAVMVPPGSPYADDPEAGADQGGTGLAGLPILPPGEKHIARIPRFFEGFEIGTKPGPISIAFTDAVAGSGIPTGSWSNWIGHVAARARST